MRVLELFNHEIPPTNMKSNRRRPDIGTSRAHGKLALAIGLATSLPVHAQDAVHSAEPVEEIVVISSRVPIPLRQIGTSVTILDSHEIDARGNLSLVDVLRQMPAIATSNSGGAGKSTSLRIRGEEGFRTLTLLDGIRLQDPSGPQVGAHMEHILSNGVSRVEILRGPQGLSYGADAGGIVNISSRQPDQQGLALNLDSQLGSFGSRQYSANVGGGGDRADFFLSLSDFSTDGFNTQASDTELRDKDGYDNSTLHARVGVDLAEGWRLEGVHRVTEGETWFDGCWGGGMTVHDCSGDFDLKASRLALTYESESFTHLLAYASTTTDRENFALGESSFRADGELTRWEYVGSATNLPGFDLVLGADHEEALNSGVGRDNLGLYVEALSDFSDSIFFTAGVRQDDNDDYGNNTSYRLSGAYLFELGNGDTLKFKASHGTGFRAPSPYEVAYNAGPSAYPPASLVSLKQETSSGWEAGIEYLGDGGLRLEAVYFDQDVEDAIFYDMVDFSGYLQDSGLSTSKGVELSAEFDLSEQWHLSGNYTYNDTERPNGWPRRRRPEQLFNAGVSYYGLQDRLNLNAFYRVSRDSYDEVASNLVQLDNFAVLDLSANYRINEAFQVYGRVENLTDKDYQETIGYNTPGRTYYMGFKLNLRLLQ